MSKSTAHSLRSFNREKGLFELITQRGGNVQVVNLEQKTCSCGKWEALHYPCSHVLGACAKLSLNSWQYVDRCYSISSYGTKKVVRVQQDYEMEWTLKNEEKLIFVEFVGKVVTIEKNVPLRPDNGYRTNFWNVFCFFFGFCKK
ncbi:hypothetical protein LXL04_001180 [Taraxacum kok-saghyz]